MFCFNFNLISSAFSFSLAEKNRFWEFARSDIRKLGPFHKKSLPTSLEHLVPLYAISLGLLSVGQ